LQDIYKSCFQDLFGVAHALGTMEQVENYIAYESAKADSFESNYYEPCGWRGNFIRVNLKAVREGKISAKELALAFMASANNTESVDLHSWLTEWQQIESIVREIYPNMEGFARDSATIRALIFEGRYVMHHSREYNNYYSPHYRIISKDQFIKLKDRLK
jgi:hypothetical protein